MRPSQHYSHAPHAPNAAPHVQGVVWRAMWRVFGNSFIYTAAIKVIHDIIMFASPWLLERLLHHMGAGGSRGAYVQGRVYPAGGKVGQGRAGQGTGRGSIWVGAGRGWAGSRLVQVRDAEGAGCGRVLEPGLGEGAGEGQSQAYRGLMRVLRQVEAGAPQGPGCSREQLTVRALTSCRPAAAAQAARSALRWPSWEWPWRRTSPSTGACDQSGTGAGSGAQARTGLDRGKRGVTPLLHLTSRTPTSPPPLTPTTPAAAAPSGTSTCCFA